MHKDQPLADIKTMRQRLTEWVGPARFRTFLLGIFGAAAMVLAAAGIYAVISYAVSQRTHEIAIRMGVGAQSRNVLWMVIGQGLKLVFMGLVIGPLAALALTRVLSSFLFGVTAADPATFAGVALLLAAVALLACYIPARRATKVDPIEVLRHE